MKNQGSSSALSCLAIAILVCVLIGGGLVVTLIVRRVTEEPFDDSDMAIARPELPDDENAYVLLHKAASVVHWDEHDVDAVRAMVNGTPEPADYPEEFLASN